MVTEGLLVDCQHCTEEEEKSNSLHPHSRDASLKGPRTNSSSSEKEIGALLDLQRQDTPPESPRVQATPAPFPMRRDSSYRKTYDENDKKRAIPCENCALTLPPKTETGDDTLKSKFDTPRSPILRTRKPFERISKRNNNPSPPKSESSSDSESAITTKPTHRRSPSKTFNQQGTSSSGSSVNSTTSHDHYRDYTSTHEPLQPLSFSIIRQSCLRTLSCETLPPSSSPSTTPTSPTGPQTNTASATSSGGPIFFGDSQAGYTTAYVFRIPDPTARGRRRVYALMCLSPHNEKKSVKQFSALSAAFKDIASWIQNLAEMNLERSEASQNSPKLTPINELPPHIQGKTRGGSTPTSAFLSGRNRSLGGGLDSRFTALSLRSKGLAELVGMPDFFLELHARFVTLLIALSKSGL